MGEQWIAGVTKTIMQVHKGCLPWGPHKVSWGPFEVHLRSIWDHLGAELVFHRLCKASSLLILNHDLSSGIVGLRSRLVTCFYLNFTCFFEHFLQGTMGLRHRLITPPQRHLTNSLQTACGHLTIFTFPLPPPLSAAYGGRERGDISITDIRPPLLQM